MFCIYCGTKLPQNANYCYHCGAPVATNQTNHPASIPSSLPPVSPTPAESSWQFPIGGICTITFDANTVHYGKIKRIFMNMLYHEVTRYIQFYRQQNMNSVDDIFHMALPRLQEIIERMVQKADQLLQEAQISNITKEDITEA